MKKPELGRINRRQLLKWTPPTIAAISLPVHAQMSPDDPVIECTLPPVLSVLSTPKCAGDPPVGTAIIEILAADATTVRVLDLRLITDDADSSISSLPSFPAEVTTAAGQTFNWIGPASDAVTCLPLANLSLELDYNCDANDDAVLTETFDLTQVLLDAIEAES